MEYKLILVKKLKFQIISIQKRKLVMRKFKLVHNITDMALLGQVEQCHLMHPDIHYLVLLAPIDVVTLWVYNVSNSFTFHYWHYETKATMLLYKQTKY